MQLVINTRGSYLRKKGNCFLVKTNDKVFEVSANKVESGSLAFVYCLLARSLLNERGIEAFDYTISDFEYRGELM